MALITSTFSGRVRDSEAWTGPYDATLYSCLYVRCADLRFRLVLPRLPDGPLDGALRLGSRTPTGFESSLPVGWACTPRTTPGEPVAAGMHPGTTTGAALYYQAPSTCARLRRGRTVTETATVAWATS